MTHAEVYRELEKDKENAARWFDHKRDEYIRRALKARRQSFPLSLWDEYASPRKNLYLFNTIVTNRHFDKGSAFSALALRREDRGYTVYQTGVYRECMVGKNIYLWHMFERYAERIKVEKTGIDLIRHFFERQVNARAVSNQRLAGKSVRYNGKDHMFLCITDGVLLGENLARGSFLARTFITYEMATGQQQVEFGQEKKNLLTWEEETRRLQDSSYWYMMTQLYHRKVIK